MNIHVVSLGCDKNLVDSEVILGLAREAGHMIVNEPEDADIAIVNTCGFIMDATQEGIEVVLGLSRYKREGRCKALIVTGCMAKRYQAEIEKELPEVDAVVGPGDYGRIAEVIERLAAGERGLCLLEDKSPAGEDALLGRMPTTGHVGYLKIADGCDNCCTYCTIPSIRGRYRSRELESLVKEAQMLSRHGVRELVLVAQDTTLYGTDLYEKPALGALLAALSKTDIAWLRLLYAYPENITDDLIAEMARNPKICHYLDMPVQHADDGILLRMNRRGTSAVLRERIAALRSAMPDIALRTTLIAGFPGEDEDAFRRLMDFAREMRFNHLGVFPYSKEAGTPAAKMKNQVPQAVRRKRAKQIMQLQREISDSILQELVGSTLRVLTDARMPDAAKEKRYVYAGRSYRDCMDVDGLVFFESDADILSGTFVDVVIRGAKDYDLYGEIVEGSEFDEPAQ